MRPGLAHLKKYGPTLVPKRVEWRKNEPYKQQWASSSSRGNKAATLVHLAKKIFALQLPPPFGYKRNVCDIASIVEMDHSRFVSFWTNPPTLVALYCRHQWMLMGLLHTQ